MEQVNAEFNVRFTEHKAREICLLLQAHILSS